MGDVDGVEEAAGAAGVAAAGAAFDSVLVSDFSPPFVEPVLGLALDSVFSVFSEAFFDDE